MNEHIILLGDSILDNAPYVTPRPECVLHQVRAAGCRATLRARDGAVMSHVRDKQLQLRLPLDATVLVLSIGGNNGLRALARMQHAPWTTLTSFFGDFRREYEELVDHVLLSQELPLVLCTIYQPQFRETHGWLVQAVVDVGVRLMNRAIRGAAEAHGLAVLDLWAIFTRREDYANAIEPGIPGGHKLVRNLVQLLRDGAHRAGRYVLYADDAYDADMAKELESVTRFSTARVNTAFI